MRQLCVVATLLLLSLPVPSLSATAAESFKKLLDDEWEMRMHEQPVFATQVGDHRFDDKLPSVGLADEARVDRANREFLSRLDKIDRSKLSATDRLNYDLFRLNLADRLADYDFKTYLMPITNREGFHVSFAQLPDRVPLRTVEDYDNYCARLEGFKVYAGQYIEVMREAVKEGYVLPKIVLEGWETAVDKHIVDDPTESLLYAPFEKFPDSFSPKDRERLTARGSKAITDSVVPGYRAFREFMAKEYVPSARESIAASDLPNGKAFYEYRVRHYTTLDLTPKQVHETGLAEVKRIRAEME